MSEAADLGASRSRMKGWREAVVIVADPAPWIETLTTVGGWEMAHRGPPDSALNAFWALPPQARSEQVVMRNIGTRMGYMRLVRVEGVEQQPIRPDDQAWESGGIQALDLRVVDIEATRKALHARGWRAPSDPVRYTTYGVDVIQWAPSSPDGVRLSFIQRISPPLQGWSELKQWSRLANAAITVRDMPAAKAFFSQTLAMPEASNSNTVGADGPNVLGLPWSLSRQTAVDIRGFAAGDAGEGAVELISIPEALGRDFAANAHPPNLGIVALRFQVDDIDGLARDLTARGAEVSAVQSMAIAPYGTCRACTIQAPDGVRLELFSTS
ncbi:MAG TPA: VOC family protein [Caulobacteraceae bacterium]|nr:VOC family protein [Caulobacteraceae bacterium]